MDGWQFVLVLKLLVNTKTIQKCSNLYFPSEGFYRNITVIIINQTLLAAGLSDDRQLERDWWLHVLPPFYTEQNNDWCSLAVWSDYSDTGQYRLCNDCSRQTYLQNFREENAFTGTDFAPITHIRTLMHQRFMLKCNLLLAWNCFPDRNCCGCIIMLYPHCEMICHWAH